MKLIILYGPPAVGKLTIARELEKMTGYILFHNHLVNDVQSEVMEFATKDYWRFNQRLKSLMIKGAMVDGVDGMIFTMAPCDRNGVVFGKRLEKLATKGRGETYFVKLECDIRELLKRVKQPSRKEFRKLTCDKQMKRDSKKEGFMIRIPSKNELVINNTKISARKVAERIAKHFKLGRKK